MFLSSEELRFFYNRTQYFSTERLHQLDLYWRNNSTHPIHEEMHSLIEIILITRGENTCQDQKLKLINYLDKCWSISNPMGRICARIIGYIGQFVRTKRSLNLNNH